MERSKTYKRLATYRTFAILGGLLLTIILFYSSVLASSVINEVFLVDASAFPYSQTIISVLISFKLIIPLSGLYLVTSVIYVSMAFIRPRETREKGDVDNAYFWTNSKLPAILVMCIITNGIVIGWTGIKFTIDLYDKNMFKKLIVDVAVNADFGNHSCKNIDKNNKLIFIGHNQTHVLIRKEDNPNNNPTFARDICLLK